MDRAAVALPSTDPSGAVVLVTGPVTASAPGWPTGSPPRAPPSWSSSTSTAGRPARSRRGSAPGTRSVHRLAEELDVSDGPAVAGLVARTQLRYGGVDVLVANAGVGAGGGLDAPDDTWQRAWDVNLMAHVHAARAVVPGMLARGRGLVRHDGQRCGTADQPRQRPVLGHQARRRRLRRVARGHVRRPGAARLVHLPDGHRHRDGARGRGPARGRQRGGAGWCCRWTTGVDAVMAGLLAGRFLVLTHPETAHVRAAPRRRPGPVDRRDAAAPARRPGAAVRRRAGSTVSPRARAGQGAARGRGDVRRRRARATTSPTTCCRSGRPGCWRRAVVARGGRRGRASGSSTSPPAPATSLACRSPRPGRRVVPCDFSLGMLAGRQAARSRGLAVRRRATRCGCRSPTARFDAVTISFGLRNVARHRGRAGASCAG